MLDASEIRLIIVWRKVSTGDAVCRTAIEGLFSTNERLGILGWTGWVAMLVVSFFLAYNLHKRNIFLIYISLVAFICMWVWALRGRTWNWDHLANTFRSFQNNLKSSQHIRIGLYQNKNKIVPSYESKNKPKCFISFPITQKFNEFYPFNYLLWNIRRSTAISLHIVCVPFLWSFPPASLLVITFISLGELVLRIMFTVIWRISSVCCSVPLR